MTDLSNRITSTGHIGPVQPAKFGTKSGGRATGRVSKRDWLKKALEVFVSDGINGVRVADLARKLRISKSGFYWHFRDLEDLQESMKLYWVDEFSNQFMEDAREHEGSVSERLVSLIRVIRARQSGKLDLAFAQWAQNDPSVRGLVDRVRDMRFSFAKEILAETGAKEPELTTRAQLFVVYFMWSEVVFESDGDGLVGEDLERVLDTIIG